jgi:hypothetical protein
MTSVLIAARVSHPAPASTERMPWTGWVCNIKVTGKLTIAYRTSVSERWILLSVDWTGLNRTDLGTTGITPILVPSYRVPRSGQCPGRLINRRIQDGLGIRGDLDEH